jgi:hypothetical protein
MARFALFEIKKPQILNKNKELPQSIKAGAGFWGRCGGYPGPCCIYLEQGIFWGQHRAAEMPKRAQRFARG